MKVILRGVRGSIPTPGSDTVRYGGNTTCLEILTDAGARIILDAGTGIRQLGLEMAREMPLECTIFITHTHWDHIQGLPFFVPLFAPGNTVTLHGPFDPITMQSIKDVLSLQMEYRYFPVREAELKADIRYETMQEGKVVQVADATVTSLLMNHPVITYGYKIRCNDRTFFFTGDHERYYNIFNPDDDDFQEYEKHVRTKQKALADFLSDVDLMVADAQYTQEEYPGKVGWGHSSHEQILDLATEAGVGRLILTHHEPTRPDDALDVIRERALEVAAGRGLEVDLARENMQIDV